MAQIFPKWTNQLPPVIGAVVVIKVAVIVGFLWYFASPKFTDAGYRPKQPVEYSHKLHAGDLNIDCRYCHVSVETSAKANIPPTGTCMNCHALVKKDSPKIAPIVESWATGQPIQWVRVHKTPEYAFFNHSAHLRAGVGCESCHGNVAAMEVVMQMQPLSMSWCLDCHRNPDKHLRPKDQITVMGWTPPANQAQLAASFKQERQLQSPVDCSYCHR